MKFQAEINSNIKEILQNYRNIAIVGLSDSVMRPSNKIARYLQKAQYRIYPVNPNHKQILGKTCYPDLLSIGKQIEIVNIFRRPQFVMTLVEQAITIQARVIWMQLGVINYEAAARALEAGLEVVMDHCIKIEHIRYLR